jgi:hypothetical protein
VRREGRNLLKNSSGADFLLEHGEFRRSYRWAISARRNPCEVWGLTRLHVPKESLLVDWDGFPLDSTFTRGRLEEEKLRADGQAAKSVYDKREFFDYKYANGMPILSVQINEEEALRRAKLHVELYHHRLSQLGVDYLIDLRSELEVTGVQLIHLPFWHCVYQFRPKSALRHFMRPITKNILIEGSGRAVINGELAITHNDKVYVNGIIAAISAAVFFLLGIAAHPGFLLLSLFALSISGVSLYLNNARKARHKTTTLNSKDAVVKAWATDEELSAQ